ncbi:23S rRNA (cytosine1962-C5)-methyltransferase [Ruminococcaceae bacterium YRB3002]|nr:23S rRNA (cytosine1962-C5)-methyltransferase [Ruminococcaceae bacterium YRB3002]
MRTDRKYPGVTVTKKAEAAIRRGHPWVYDTEITSSGASEIVNGSIVDVLTENGRYLGSGFISQASKIRVRILGNNANETFGEAFWQRRVRYALDYRRTVMGDGENGMRLIHGESDGFPGLTVDRYDDLLSAEVLSYGTEQVKDVIYRALVDELARDGITIRGIYERNESPLRQKEDLPQYSGWAAGYDGGVPRADITENGIRYTVDVAEGQKTGFFLDQKYNRLQVAKIARGKTVLDCFTHTGSFGLNAAMGGALHVTCVDVSRTAVDMASHNAVLNHLDGRMDFICADVFELLPSLVSGGGSGNGANGGVKYKYDFIILDPPAFTKSRSTADNAARGYKEINYRAMKLLPRGGYLATCSCSHFMRNEDFKKMLLSAAHDAGVSLKLIEERRAAPDHPVAMAIEETDYLKFYLVQVT